MKDISKTDRVEEAQHFGRIGTLDILGVGDGALQYDSTGRGKNHDQNNQNDAGLDGTQGLPDFSKRSVK
jgi:hypothetical protein